MPSLRALAISTGSGNASDDSFTTSGKLRVGDLTLAHDGVQFDGFNTCDSRELSEGGPAVLALFGTGSKESVLSKEAPQEDGNSRGGGSAVSKPRSSSQQSLRLSETIDWSCLKAGRIIGKGGSGSVRKMRLASTKQVRQEGPVKNPLLPIVRFMRIVLGIRPSLVLLVSAIPTLSEGFRQSCPRQLRCSQAGLPC
eukprot:5066261-Pleurochrysis_carterae.AAC.2